MHVPPTPTPSPLYPDAEPSAPDAQICARSHFVAVPLGFSLPRHFHLEPGVWGGMEGGGEVPAGTESGIAFSQGGHCPQAFGMLPIGNQAPAPDTGGIGGG